MRKKWPFLPEGLYSQKDTVCKLKYSQKLSRRNGSLENLIDEPLLYSGPGAQWVSKLIKTWIYEKRQIILNFYGTKHTFSLYNPQQTDEHKKKC